MKRTLAVVLGVLVLALAASATAGAANTYTWSKTFGDGAYTYVGTYTKSGNGYSYIRTAVDNPHSFNMRTAPCGYNYQDFPPVTIPAHNTNWFNSPVFWQAGQCLSVFIRSEYGTQSLWGHVFL
jgi:hypothetical protein